MVEKRYQIHLATCFNDVAAERLKVENVLLNFGVFPWGFSEKRTSLNTSRARKQIDDCDYIMFIVSNCYGDLSASGISYLHLDFIYALNKGKTILSFIDGQSHLKQANFNAELQTNVEDKLASFKQLLKRESSYYYEYNNNNLLDLERGVKNLFSTAVKEKPAIGWIRPQPASDLSNSNQFEIDRLRARVQLLEQQLVLKSTPSSVHDVLNDTGAETSEQEVVSIAYRTHAYQDGNFKDIHPTRELNWNQILKILAPHFHRPALESAFMRALNEYLESTGLEVAREFLPRAHAVDRTHIDARSLQQIKLQMKWNNWIVPQPNVTGSNRIYWALTPEGQRHLSTSTIL